MKTFRKIIVSTAAVCIVGSLAACSKQEAPSTSGNGAPTTSVGAPQGQGDSNKPAGPSGTSDLK